MKKTFELEDLDCANCAQKMQDAVAKLDGVKFVTVNFLSQKMTLEADDDVFDDVLKKAVKEIKETEGGRESMCKITEDFMIDAAIEAALTLGATTERIVQVLVDKYGLEADAALQRIEEFKNDKSEEFIDIVVNTHNKQAIAILIGIIAISIPLLFVPGFTIKMIVWTVFVYISIFVIFVPYALGNSEMKKYKKCLGIVDERVLYADLKNTGNIHALNKPMLFMANIAGVLIIVLAVLIDAGLIFHLKTFEGAYILTAMTSSIIATNLILLPIAFMIDNSRNEVISENSDLNANYNRSRKKIFSDYIIILSWFNNIFSVAVTIITLLLDSEFLIVVMLAVYMLVP